MPEIALNESVVAETKDSQLHILTFVFTRPHWSSLVLQSVIKSDIPISSQQCLQFFGINQANNLLMLLHPESWVSSIGSGQLKLRQYVEHFFISGEYGCLTSHVHPVQAANRDFAFCRYDKVMMVKGGLKF
jgi:hypothetical protein